MTRLREKFIVDAQGKKVAGFQGDYRVTYLVSDESREVNRVQCRASPRGYR